MTSISIICPFYNEAAILEKAVARTIANLERDFNGDYELILVNDGSTDDSLAALTDVLKQHKDKTIRVIGSPVNHGRGRALKYGIDAAQSDIIVTTEVDCSWGDDIAKRLYDELQNRDELDFVIASPHCKGGALKNVSANRVLLTKWGNRFIRAFFEPEITMNTGMTRGYRKDVIQPLVTTQNGKEFHLEVLLKLITLGFKASEIPAILEWQDHKLQKTDAPKRKSTTRIFKTMFTHLQFVAIAQPMKYFSLWAAGFFIAGLILTAWAFINFFRPDVPSAFVAITALISFIISLMLGGFAVLFTHIRDIMRNQWMTYYPDQKQPPSVRPSTEFLTTTKQPEKTKKTHKSVAKRKKTTSKTDKV
jgi:glycosyltransferase involved in cell wall biosynthesis